MASFGELVIQNMHMTPREEKFFIFGLKCFLYDFSKLAMFLIFFGLVHKLDYFVFAYAVMLPLRKISGGLHFKHYTSCLIFSFCFFLAAIMLLAPIKLPFIIVMIAFMVCAVVIYVIGPIQAPTRPALAETEIAKRRKNAMFAIVYAAVLTGLFFESRLGMVGFWVIMLHTLQLVIAFIKKKGGVCHA